MTAGSLAATAATGIGSPLNPLETFVSTVAANGGSGGVALTNTGALSVGTVGTRGAAKIPETEQEDPLPLSLTPYPPGLVPGLVEGRREILLLKKNFDVFTNPNSDSLLDALDPEEILVFGVATDVCDDAAIRGFLQRGRRVRFVEDAARGLDEGRVAACIAVWRERGVAFTTAAEAAEAL